MTSPPRDYSAMTGPVAAGDLAAFAAPIQGSTEYAAASKFVSTRGKSVLGGVLLLALFGLMGILALVELAAGLLSRYSSSDAILGPSILLAVSVVLVTIVVIWVRRQSGPDVNSWTSWYRLSRFAGANGMRFTAVDSGLSYPGSLFGIGNTSWVFGHLSFDGGRFFDIGNYTYATGTGTSLSTSNWGYLAVQLDRSLPNMVLDAKRNNRLFGTTNLPFSFAKDQVLSLEGDFDRYFTLYCPKEYESDALYVFTPDLMALLVDETQRFDVEIVEDWMFLYSAKPLNLVEVPTLTRLFAIIDTVGAKAIGQSERYADDRGGGRAMDMVAPAGQRLRRGWPVFAIIAAALVLGGVVLFSVLR